jgi:uncharacterized protein YeeX (DUF496 family)
MDKINEVLERLHQLNITVRKLVKQQRDMRDAQKEVVLRQESSKVVNEEMKGRQEELMRVMVSIRKRFETQEEVWLSKTEPKDYLCISERTFQRRTQVGNWTRRRNEKGWWYLQSSLVRGG